MTTTLTNFARDTESYLQAAERAVRLGYRLDHYATPIEDAREGITPAQADAIAAEDPGLIIVRGCCCSGCGDVVAQPVMHDGQPFCEGCEADPAVTAEDVIAIVREADTMTADQYLQEQLAHHVLARGGAYFRLVEPQSPQKGFHVPAIVSEFTDLASARTAYASAMARYGGRVAAAYAEACADGSGRYPEGLIPIGVLDGEPGLVVRGDTSDGFRSFVVPW